jgi:hypothetical protein
MDACEPYDDLVVSAVNEYNLIPNIPEVGPAGICMHHVPRIDQTLYTFCNPLEPPVHFPVVHNRHQRKNIYTFERMESCCLWPHRHRAVLAGGARAMRHRNDHGEGLVLCILDRREGVLSVYEGRLVRRNAQKNNQKKLNGG